MPNIGETTLLEPAIALTYGMLAAHTRGLGTCWIGAAIRALNNNKKIKELLGISRHMKIAGVLTLGYPAVTYHRVPPRKPVNAKWYL
jgi:nitroreductase